MSKAILNNPRFVSDILARKAQDLLKIIEKERLHLQVIGQREDAPDVSADMEKYRQSLLSLGLLCAQSLKVDFRRPSAASDTETLHWTRLVGEVNDETGVIEYFYPDIMDGPYFLVQRIDGSIDIEELVEESGLGNGVYFEGLVPEEIYAYAPMPSGIWNFVKENK